jgi:hypothetical protein
VTCRPPGPPPPAPPRRPALSMTTIPRNESRDVLVYGLCTEHVYTSPAAQAGRQVLAVSVLCLVDLGGTYRNLRYPWSMEQTLNIQPGVDGSLALSLNAFSYHSMAPHAVHRPRVPAVESIPESAQLHRHHMLHRIRTCICIRAANHLTRRGNLACPPRSLNPRHCVWCSLETGAGEPHASVALPGCLLYIRSLPQPCLPPSWSYFRLRDRRKHRSHLHARKYTPKRTFPSGQPQGQGIPSVAT